MRRVCVRAGPAVSTHDLDGSQALTLRQEIGRWEARGYAGVLDDAGGVHDRDSLMSALTADELDEPHDVPLYGWTGDWVAYGGGRALGLTADEMRAAMRLGGHSLSLRQIQGAVAQEIHSIETGSDGSLA